MINIGVIGYGNLGRGVEYAVAQNPDMKLRSIFTRRHPSSILPITSGVEVFSVQEAHNHTAEIDVMILCGGSAIDLPMQTPQFSKLFNVVDSFDTHANIPDHFNKVDDAAKASGKTAIISTGWDPGLFSVNKLIFEAILPRGNSYTFWGKGVSQGHSDAIRQIDGVIDARQYTVPVDGALEAVRNGLDPVLETRQKHTRECFVVVEDGADMARIEQEIVSMPNYFSDYDTSVNFVSAKELADDHSGMPHGGFVIRSGKTGSEFGNSQIVEFGLKLDSNPEFTSGVLVAYARAAYRLNMEGVSGCMTVLDIPPSYLCADSGDDLRRRYL